MSRRIEGGLTSQLNPFGPQWQTNKSPNDVPSVGAQVQQALFSRAKPMVLDPAQYPHLAEQMKLLQKYKKKLSQMAGDKEEDYDVVLCDGGIAQIDENGTIYVGAKFLQKNADNPEVIIGALAHEIGHRPKRWQEYRVRRELTRDELQALCRHEETRADIFAGKALAEMELSAEPLVEFLQRIEQGPHPEYFPANVRADVIREAHQARAYARDSRKKLFPEFERMASPKGHLGEY
jgi:hypothetical protein